ncbi:MAG: glucose 1-dehydrogenase [Myxococcota bacterium]
MAKPDPALAPSLEGRVALVTGSTRGLGRAMARGFAAAGARVVVSGRSQDACDAVAREIEADGGEAIGIAAEMERMADLDRLVEGTVARFGALDVLVNNAADATLGLLEQLTEEDWDRVHAVNAKAPVFLAIKALPHLARSGRGSVVNLISVGVWNGTFAMGLYRSSKSALLGATKVMSKEWASRGVRVNCIAPGTFETDMIGWMDDDVRARAKEMAALGRFADPAELVPAALFLASDQSSYVTGSVITVDGGLLS